MSRPYAEVIGDPIAHSKSPLIHNFWLEKLGIDAEYRACHVKPEELADYFARRRGDAEWRGCNITIPHKQAVMPFLDAIEPRAQKVGAVNTVWRQDGRLHGRNTDVEGVNEALAGLNLTDRNVVVIGAGGAARSAFAHLEGLGCGHVVVLARNPERAGHVVSDFSLPSHATTIGEAGVTITGAALVINATQLGMTGQPPMLPTILDALGDMASDGHVFDMVYAPLETGLLQNARSHGLTTSDGLLMLVGQARTAFALFFGKAPSRNYDAELRKRLTV